MMLAAVTLLSFLGCGPKADGDLDETASPYDPDRPASTDDSGAAEDSDAPPPADDDGDGAAADTDCDDADPSIYPGAEERCDAIDQDCDGVVDEGIPGDGEGCQDPGAPSAPSTIDVLHLVLRTDDGTYSGTDDGGVEICLSETHCWSPYRPDWNDLEPGEVDVAIFEGVGVERASLDRFTVQTDDGEDRWDPVGFQVVADGEVIHCVDGLSMYIGNNDGEQRSWTDPAGLGAACETVFDAPLTHGPIVGAVGPGSARIWYRTDATRRTVLRVAESDEALGSAAPAHYGYPLAGDDFASSVEIVGLSPGARYSYDLEIEGVRYGPWSFATAPADGSSGALRLAFGSCTKDDEQPIFEAVSAWDPDLFLFLGDNHYANSEDLAALRQYYRWAHERPLRQEMMASTSTLATWDDHDYTGNNTDGTAPGREIAARVFREYWANPGYGGAEGVYFEHRWGDVGLFFIDDRYWRGLDGTMLGAEQTDWLLDALEASDATFKLVASGSQWTASGSSDSWAVFPEAREALLSELVSRGVEGVVLLSGDIHRSELRRLPGASGGYDLPELTSSPMANSNSGCGSSDELLACLDDGHYFVGVEIDTAAADPTLTATIYDADGAARAAWTILRSELSL